MTTNDILALVNAGFSKDEILAISDLGNEPKTQTQSGAQTIPTVTAEQPVKITPDESAQNNAQEQQTQSEQTKVIAPVLSDAQVKQLAQALNVGKASIDVPPTVTLDDKMTEHFKNLLLGKE